MKFFILEDDPYRMAGFETALDGAEIHHALDVETAHQIWNPPYDYICLDHDLGGDTFVNSEDANTGYQFAKWLAQQKLPATTRIFIHSWNPDGARAIASALSDLPCAVIQEVFGTTLLLKLSKIVSGSGTIVMKGASSK